MRFLITFAYDGTNFNGYQKQSNKRTIQAELERALEVINNEKVTVYASGRTDSKVHALNQKAHFDLNIKINETELNRAMNSLLPNDIYIKDVKKVSSNFHARFNVIKKEYIYKINTKEYDSLATNYIFQYNKPLNIDKMKAAIKVFEGTHNFKAYTKADETKDNYIRTIYQTKITQNKGIITITFIGNGFLRYMVRNMVGSLIEVGSGKKEIDDIILILNSLDRKKAGITAHPEGLYLNKVIYK